MPTIEAKNITYIYNRGTPNAKTALDNISFTIGDGITGLIGKTGCGKSTLVHLLNGLKKADSGEIFLDGVNIWENPQKIKQVRFDVGLVMQYPEYQLFADTVKEDIAFGPKNMGITGEELDERVKKAMEFTGLEEDILEKSPFDLSGGQKRRVALAGVIAMYPKVLILDEPAAGLDPEGRREILGGIKQYSKNNGATVLIVSHSMEDMALYCDSLIVMTEAKILMHKPLADVFSQYDLLQSIGLDIPLITRFAAELKKRGLDIGEDIYTVDYAIDRFIEKYVRN